MSAFQGPTLRRSITLLRRLMAGASPDSTKAYRLWLDLYDRPPPGALACLPPLDGGHVAIAMIVGSAGTGDVPASISSLTAQIYRNWSLQIFTTEPPTSRLRDALTGATGKDDRVHVIAEPVSSARMAVEAVLKRSTADFIALLQAGDRLAPTALYEVVAEFSAAPGARAVFTDEDVMDAGGRRLPSFKPGFSPDAAIAQGGVGQLTVYRSELAREALGKSAGNPLDKCPDFTVRALLCAGRTGVRHLPAILHHKARAAPSPTHGVRPLDPSASCPKVTVIVPTRDRAELLTVCVSGLLEHTRYPDLELLIVDNGSTDAATLELLRTLADDPRVRVIEAPGPFNFARLNNLAAKAAAGDVLVMLNNDTEVLHPDWLERMVAHAIRNDVGAVGAKLLYPHGTVQHAGIAFGRDGSAIHVGRHARSDAPGYLDQLTLTRDVSAVTAACLAIRRSVFEDVGGMDERLAVTWNDVDLCMRVRARGLRVVWTPDAVLTHHEGLSRGLDADAPDKTRRFRDEQKLIASVWGDRLTDDPWLNPNLTVTGTGKLRLAPPRRRRIWEHPA